MIRFYVNCIRHTLRAVVFLLVLPCVLEVGLRLHDQFAQSDTPGAQAQALTIPSRYLHHELKPLHRFSTTNSDTGESIAIQTNSFGLRGTEPAIPKPPGTYRIVCLGDENVFGPEVPDAQLFVSRLRDLLQTQTRLRIDVINAGVPGYCPLLSYLQVRQRLLALQPDLLILNFDMADVAEDYEVRRHTVMDNADVPLACVASKGTDDVSWLGRWTNQCLVLQWLQRQASAIWMSQAQASSPREIGSATARYAWLEDTPPDWTVHIRQTLSAIDQLHQVAQGVHARLVLAVYPAPWQVSTSASAAPGVREALGVPRDALFTSRVPFDILEEYARRRDLPFCNAANAFESADAPEQLYLDTAPRFSAKGHELYAQQLAQCLTDLLFRTFPSQ